MRHFRDLCCVLVVLTLAACSRSTRETAPHGDIVERSGTPMERASPEDRSRRVHVVQSGDTLFSIAWRHELDIRNLIDWNGLQDPDLILVGQSLFLEPAATSISNAAVEGGQRDLPNEDGALADPRGNQPAARSASVLTSLPLQHDSLWIWPIQGPLVSPYGETAETGDGIGIGGDIGADIRASAPGEVVYAGRGLAAYGNLIIVKHNDTFLSAYGHNDELLVEQGNAVAQGQVIARMGLGPERRPQVHFEIRRNGAPVDPTEYLPK